VIGGQPSQPTDTVHPTSQTKGLGRGFSRGLGLGFDLGFDLGFGRDEVWI
jgi:hypothetical protein